MAKKFHKKPFHKVKWFEYEEGHWKRVQLPRCKLGKRGKYKRYSYHREGARDRKIGVSSWYHLTVQDAEYMNICTEQLMKNTLKEIIDGE